MIHITHVRIAGENQHEHISHVKWRNSSTNATGEMTRADMVDWINKGNAVYVTDGTNTVSVGVVKANPSYLRTYADGKWTDNLLALPRF